MSLRRETLSWIFVVGLLVVVAGAAAYVIWPQLQPRTTLRLGDGVFTTRLVAIHDDQTNDPVNASSLDPGRAVILMYSHEQPLSVTIDSKAAATDLVWMNNAKKVIYIVKNVTGSGLNQFQSTEPARYILELPAGTVGQRTIAIGSQAIFNEHIEQGGFGG